LKYRSTWLVANNLKVKLDSKFEVAPGVIFRKAFKYEIERFQPIIQQMMSGNLGWIPPFEFDWIPQTSGDGYTSRIIENPKMWKYWVLSEEGGGITPHELQKVMNITSPELDLSIRLMFSIENRKRFNSGYSPGQYYIGDKHWGMGSRQMESEVLTADILEGIRTFFKRMKNLEESHPFVGKALTKFNDLRSIPHNSDMRTVGYFSVIEGLITHQPRLNESLDSITHQLKNKIVLLNKRFDTPLAISSLFGNISEKNVWSKMYGYRSKIAHGDIPDFGKEFMVLKDRETVNSFLHQVCKALLRFGLDEPVFLEDLKEC